MGLSESKVDQTTWSICITMKSQNSNIEYTLSNQSENLVKVVNSPNGESLVVISNPLTGEMFLDSKCLGTDGDLQELTRVLKGEIIATLAKRWNVVIDEEKEEDDEEEDDEEEEKEEDDDEEKEEDEEEDWSD